MKRFFAWLDGKKTAIAAGYWTIAVPVVQIVFPEGAPSQLNKGVAIVGVLLTAIGLGHKAIKEWSPLKPEPK